MRLSLLQTDLPRVLAGIAVCLAFAQGAQASVGRCSLPPTSTAAEFTDALNVLRGALNLRAVQVQRQLATAAQDYACMMAVSNHFDHIGPDKSDPGSRTARSGYRYCSVYENIAVGQRTVSEVMQGWIDSLPHRNAMQAAEVYEIGLGVASAPAGGMPDGKLLYWVLLLAAPGC